MVSVCQARGLFARFISCPRSRAVARLARGCFARSLFVVSFCVVFKNTLVIVVEGVRAHFDTSLFFLALTRRSKKNDSATLQVDGVWLGLLCCT